MFHNLLHIFVSICFSATVLVLEHTLPLQEPTRAIAAGIIGAALVFGSLFSYSHLLKFFYRIRLMIMELAAFEGGWVECWRENDEERFSIAEISFDPHTSRHKLEGQTFDGLGNSTGEHWRSDHLVYEREGQRLAYVHRGRQTKQQVFGATCMYFDNSAHSSGSGLFLDNRLENSMRCHSFTFRRIDAADRLWKTNAGDWIRKNRQSFS